MTGIVVSSVMRKPSVDSALEYAVYGKPAADAPGDTILARTASLSAEDIIRFRQYIPLDVPDDPAGALALAPLPRRGNGEEPVLAYAARQGENMELPFYIYIKVPPALLETWGGDAQLLMAVVEAVPELVSDRPVPPLVLPGAITWTREKRMALFEQAYDLVKQEFAVLVALTGAALHARGLLIHHFPGGLDERLTLIQAMALLLPVSLRARLTFTTYSLSIPEATPAIVFSEAASPTDRWCFDWHTFALPDTLPETPYMNYLKQLWRGDIPALVEDLHRMDTLAVQLMPGQSQTQELQAVIARHHLDNAVRSEEPVSAEALLKTLTGHAPPLGQDRVRYMERLLMAALEERHTAAAEYLAQQMDNDPELDMQLAVIFNQALESQPDAVYVFVRTHLTEKVKEPWLARLHEAAERSLTVAIEQGDTAMVTDWLRLISREPARYHLSDVLHQGLLTARTRVVEGDTLAVDLLTLAVKRDADVVPVLLADNHVLGALPDSVRAAIIDHRSDAIEALLEDSRELFLLAVVQAAQANNLCITVTIVRALWELYQQPGSLILSEPYQPINVLRTLLAGNPDCLEEGALESLLALILAAGEDDLFLTVAPQVSPEAFSEALTNALEQSGRPLLEGLTLPGHLANEGKLSYQALADIHATLFLNTSREADREPVAENLARLLNQHADITVATGALWKMLELAAATRSELIVRVATRRLLAELNDMATESGLIDSLARLRKTIVWSQPARNQVMAWWRNFCRSQPVARLQKLEKLLEPKRGQGLEDMRHVVQTALAIRRVIGQKSLEEFASDISTAYRVLQLLADSFDPDTRPSLTIDAPMLRTILGAKIEDLSPDARHVLATNLKGLAQLITSLAENRSKPTLLSRDESVDRALMTGEQQPESALDVMKFLSGFLDGTQNQKNEQG